MPEAPVRVAGVVLAAGTSSRMGRNKLLLDVGGEPLVRRVVRTAVEAGLDPVVVVLGHEATEVARAIGDVPHRETINERYAESPRFSLQRGIANVPEGCAGAIVLLGDMPFVTKEMLREIALKGTGKEGAGALLVVSTYGEVQAPPTFYGISLFSEISDLSSGCGKKIVEKHRTDAATLSWPASRLADLDIAADYERARAALTPAGSP
jgi:molybdenum cofactor cytidylyltransferase